MAALGDAQCQFLGSINSVGAAMLAMAAPHVRFTTILFLTALNAETGIVETVHVALARLQNPVGGD